MNVSLRRWREIDAAKKKASEALQLLSRLMMETAIALKQEGDIKSIEFLMGLWDKVENARSSLPDTHPQSEWLGGSSDDHKNHTLREPNCCPMPRRQFTKAEIEEAGVECLGPCQWREKK